MNQKSRRAPAVQPTANPRPTRQPRPATAIASGTGPGNAAISGASYNYKDATGGSGTSTAHSSITTTAQGSGSRPHGDTGAITVTGVKTDIFKLPGYNNRLYVAIRKLRRSALAPRSFGNIAPAPVDKLGSLTCGINVNGTFMRHLYEEKCNVSLSFEPKSYTCHNCLNSPHHTFLGGKEGQEAPPCIIMTDQAFPAALPSRNGLRCPAIIRVEDATIRDLLSALKSITFKVKLPAGTTILLSSLSHLCRVGTSAYATDFVNAVQELEKIYGPKLRVVHGFSLPTQDIWDIQCTRSLFDILGWLSNIDRRNQYHLPASTEAYIKGMLVSNAPENPLGPLELAHRLPTNMKTKEQAAFTAGSCCGLQSQLKATRGTEDFIESSRILLKSLSLN
jgi:hypothetical protein